MSIFIESVPESPFLKYFLVHQASSKIGTAKPVFLITLQWLIWMTVNCLNFSLTVTTSASALTNLRIYPTLKLSPIRQNRDSLRRIIFFCSFGVHETDIWAQCTQNSINLSLDKSILSFLTKKNIKQVIVSKSKISLQLLS